MSQPNLDTELNSSLRTRIQPDYGSAEKSSPWEKHPPIKSSTQGATKGTHRHTKFEIKIFTSSWKYITRRLDQLKGRNIPWSRLIRCEFIITAGRWVSFVASVSRGVPSARGIPTIMHGACVHRSLPVSPSSRQSVASCDQTTYLRKTL